MKTLLASLWIVVVKHHHTEFMVGRVFTETFSSWWHMWTISNLCKTCQHNGSTWLSFLITLVLLSAFFKSCGITSALLSWLCLPYFDISLPPQPNNYGLLSDTDLAPWNNEVNGESSQKMESDIHSEKWVGFICISQFEMKWPPYKSNLYNDDEEFDIDQVECSDYLVGDCFFPCLESLCWNAHYS